MTTSPPAIELPDGFEEQARALCSTMEAIHRRGWCDGTGGNFSVVIQRPPELQLLMAPSGVDKGQVKPDELIVVDGSGKVVRGDGRVSAEMRLHQTIITSTAAGAVLHTHSQAATLLSLQAIRDAGDAHTGAGQREAATVEGDVSDPASEGGPSPVAHLEIEGLEMLKGLEGIKTHATRIRIPVLANDQDLERLSDAARPHLVNAPHGILIAGHGLYAWGEHLQQAMRHLEILEFLLEQHWRQRLWNALLTRS